MLLRTQQLERHHPDRNAIRRTEHLIYDIHSQTYRGELGHDKEHQRTQH